jgi:threonine dehydratase
MQRIRECGADVVVQGHRYADALAASEAWVKESNAVAIHAFDRDETMLGQGTVDVELAGAGLIAGIAAWYAGNVVGVEPLTSRCLPMPGRRAIP